MKISLFLTRVVGIFIMAAMIQSFSAPAGGDHFKISVNNKMLLEHFVHSKQKIQDVSFASYKPTDVMTIQYSHCGEVGKARAIKIKDAAGKLVKEWKFEGSKEAAMRITMKEFSTALPKNSGASLYYASKELPNGILLCRVTANQSKKSVQAR
ncbi:MAG: hypothetical protein ACXWV3_08025 [Flavisolibacter sp.]